MSGATNERERPIRVLIAKPGLDGHDVGAKLVCRALMDAGMEVIYTGLRQTPQAIARAALEEGVDAIGLSILSGAHLPICEQLAAELQANGLEGLLWIVGGNIPAGDQPALAALGVDGVFPTGAAFDSIVALIRERCGRPAGGGGGLP